MKFSNKIRNMGLLLAFLMLFGAAYLGGTISSSRSAAFAQAKPPTQAATPAEVTPSTQATPEPTQETQDTANPVNPNDKESIEQPEKSQADLQALAKISADQANQAALAQIPGTVVSTRLVEENGRVVYDVYVKPNTNGPNQEVTVDATDGKVLKTQAGDMEDNKSGPDTENDKSGPEQDARDD